MINDIKKSLEKLGFEEKGKTNEGIIIFKKIDKGDNNDD